MSDHLFNFFFVANKSVIFPCSQTLGLLNDVKMIALKSRLTKTETKAVLITERSLAEAGVDDCIQPIQRMFKPNSNQCQW